jgi:hypothetical protein
MPVPIAAMHEDDCPRTWHYDIGATLETPVVQPVAYPDAVKEETDEPLRLRVRPADAGHVL